jgi:hypothetical protein
MIDRSVSFLDQNKSFYQPGRIYIHTYLDGLVRRCCYGLGQGRSRGDIAEGEETATHIGLWIQEVKTRRPEEFRFPYNNIIGGEMMQ